MSLKLGPVPKQEHSKQSDSMYHILRRLLPLVEWRLHLSANSKYLYMYDVCYSLTPFMWDFVQTNKRNRCNSILCVRFAISFALTITVSNDGLCGFSSKHVISVGSIHTTVHGPNM
jgi:hypothetical protein